MFIHLDGMSLELTFYFVKINGLHTMKRLKNSHHRVFAHFRNRDDLQHSSHHTKRVQVVYFGLCHFAIFLCQQDQTPVILVGCFDQFQAVFLGNCNRQQHTGKQHGVLNRQHVIDGGVAHFCFFCVLALSLIDLCFLDLGLHDLHVFNIFIIFHKLIIGIYSKYAILHNHD